MRVCEVKKRIPSSKEEEEEEEEEEANLMRGS